MGDRLVQAIVLVTDLESARHRMEALGLTVLDGGRHPGRGTANLIVPFGTQYLELLAVVDEADARSSPQGRPVLAALARRGPGPARWSTETGDIEATAARVALPIEDRCCVLLDGTTVRWRCVGVDAAWDEPWRCAFMVWHDPLVHPARWRCRPPKRRNRVCPARGRDAGSPRRGGVDSLDGWARSRGRDHLGRRGLGSHGALPGHPWGRAPDHLTTSRVGSAPTSSTRTGVRLVNAGRATWPTPQARAAPGPPG